MNVYVLIHHSWRDDITAVHDVFTTPDLAAARPKRDGEPIPLHGWNHTPSLGWWTTRSDGDGEWRIETHRLEGA